MGLLIGPISLPFQDLPLPDVFRLQVLKPIHVQDTRLWKDAVSYLYFEPPDGLIVKNKMKISSFGKIVELLICIR